MQINREHFEAWLMSQPANRRFYYFGTAPESTPPCLICTYLKELFKGRFIVGGAVIEQFDINFNRIGQDVIPKWLNVLLQSTIGENSKVHFTAKDAQLSYLSLFPPSLEVEDAQPSSVEQPQQETAAHMETRLLHHI